VDSPSENGRIRFGAFDFDLQTRELRRDGVPVRLQPQPAQVLAVLLSRPGEIVTRDELRAAIWAETFIDFDRGLNFCVSQIRQALGDSSESPRYVKTLPKRGYQFIAPIAPIAPLAPIATPPVAQPASPNRRRTLILVLAAILAALAVFLYIRTHPGPSRVAVARFDNQTGDRGFDRFADTLTDAVIVELTASGENRLAVIGNAAILRQPPPQRDLLAVHDALHADYILLGSLQRDPDGIQVFVQLITLPAQVHVKVARIRTAESDALRAQANLTQQIVQALTPVLHLFRVLTPPAKP
jgi:DNA-binding winged helix-turn-helix (wHTH) protein/TolB-like protein